MPVVRQAETLRTVQRVGLGVDEREEAPLIVENLQSGVTPVGDDHDFGLGIDGDASWRVKLAVAFASRPEGEKEGAIEGVEDFDAMVVIVGDEDAVFRRIHGDELRRRELMLGGTTFSKSGDKKCMSHSGT